MEHCLCRDIIGLSHDLGQRHVGLSLGTDVAGKRVGLVSRSVQAGNGVNHADVDLHRRSILGLNEAVRPRALARDVEIDVLAILVLHLELTER